MNLYIVVNEWTYDEYDFHEENYYTLDYSSARAELEEIADGFDIELPKDQDSFRRYSENGWEHEDYYIKVVELSGTAQ